MIRNYFVTAFRFLLRNKLSGIINILGLSVGIASATLIYLYVVYEMSFDKHYNNYDSIYRITAYQETALGADYNSETQYPLADALRTGLPHLGEITRMFHADDGIIRIEEKKFKEKQLVLVEPQFFNLFEFDWISGSPESAVSENNSIVLTESVAKKYFGNESSLGKIIGINDSKNLRVTGIIRDPSPQTHLPIHVILSMDNLPNFVRGNYDHWNLLFGGYATYIKISGDKNLEDIEKQINTYTDQFIDRETWRNMIYKLQALSEIHHDTNFSTFNYITSRRNIWIIALVGLAILIVACINYINLSLAQSLKRSKEVGLKKVLGADRGRLTRQFIGEALITVLFSMVIAVILIEIFNPLLNRFLGREIIHSIYDSPDLLFFLLLFVVFIGIITGLYPARMISAFNPIEAIKSRITSHKKSTKIMRNGFVVVQFVISQVLVVCTIVILLQMQYISDKELGFNEKSIVVVEFPDISQNEIFKNELLKYPDIETLTFAMSGPQTVVGERFTTNVYSKEVDNPEKINTDVKAVDPDYLKTFGIEMVTGEFYKQARGKDSVRIVVINETLCRLLGYEQPVDALGDRINMGRIVGVIKDFYIESLHSKIPPIVMLEYKAFLGQVFIKTNGEDFDESIAHIQQLWEELFPEEIFEYKIYENFIKDMYTNDFRTFNIINLFAIISIVVACLGLFGLISYMLNQRTREICIRKVFGAKVSNILMHIGWGYFKLILIANIIAFPIAWYFMNKWLNNFAFRVEFHWWIYVLAFGFSIMIAFITIIYQATKSANSNPVDGLRLE